MPIISFADFRNSSLSGFDLVIVGSGPAGLTIAKAFQETSLRIAVLESGGMEPTRSSASLNEIVNVGKRRADPELVRRRCVGGTSTIWTGRCGMFDAIDYQKRAWLDMSGWPIDADVLQEQIGRAGHLLGLTPNLSVHAALRELRQPFDRLGWNSDLLAPVVWQFSACDENAETQHFTHDLAEGANQLTILRHSGRRTPMDFGRAHFKWLSESSTVFLVTEATVQEILVDPSGKHVSGLRVCGPDGTAESLRASRVVLACGGIDNARLLLASRSVISEGLGNTHRQVGRYLTYHTFTELGSFGPGKAKILRRRLGVRIHHRQGVQHSYAIGLRLSPALQRREALLNASAHLVEFGSSLNPISSIASGLRSILTDRDIGAGLRHFAQGLARPGALIEGIIDRTILKRAALAEPSKTVLGCVIEQKLNPDSRIRLSKKRDRFDQPLPEIDWRVDETEYRTALRFREVIQSELARLGLDAADTPEWESFDAWSETLTDLAHPMCTTRMSDDPLTGVVDANCQVHGVSGLYVAGSSVFSTPSHMNPTQMIVALALRLADHLNAEIQATRKDARNLLPKVRVGIVGGGDRIRRFYAPALSCLSDRIEVVGVTSRSQDTAEALARETQWNVFANPGEMVQSTDPDFLVVAVSPGANDAVYQQIVHLNCPMLLETPIAWSLRSGRKFLKEIRSSHITVGVAEQFPFLPMARLHRKIVELGGLGTPRSASNAFEDYDYHGMARLRAALGLWDDIAAVTATQEKNGATSITERTRFYYRNTGTLDHHFSTGTTMPLPSGAKGFFIEGDEARIETDSLVNLAGTVIGQSGRHETGSRLQAISIDTPVGPVLWRNPFADHALDDEQIAIATLLLGMADAVSQGGTPLYDADDALFDIEMLASMRASAARNGKKVPIGISPIWEKIRSKITARFTR